MWAWRMLLATGKSAYADYIELALYNGALSGLSLSGHEYFYVNPLCDDGAHRRKPWFGCACCPPNIARLLAQLPGYFYSVNDDDDLFVHLYATGRAEVDLVSGNRVVVTQQTNYPWDGKVEIKVKNPPAECVRLRLRRPAWAESAVVTINGEPIAVSEVDGYLQIDQARRADDVINVEFPMPVRTLAAHPFVEEDTDCVALARGPLIYCIEQADHDADIRLLAIPPGADVEARPAPDLLEGIVTLHAEGAASAVPAADLYPPASAGRSTTPAKITAIPYYAWANRTSGPMRVWIPLSRAAGG
jgi:DUF1680 family protein